MFLYNHFLELKYLGEVGEVLKLHGMSFHFHSSFLSNENFSTMCLKTIPRKQASKQVLLPHSIAFEPYVKAFQFRILNSILFTNSKLFKIGYRTDNLCSFCRRESDTIRHFFLDCPYSNSFCKCVESYYFRLRKQLLHHIT